MEKKEENYTTFKERIIKDYKAEQEKKSTKLLGKVLSFYGGVLLFIANSAMAFLFFTAMLLAKGTVFGGYYLLLALIALSQAGAFAYLGTKKLENDNGKQ